MTTDTSSPSGVPTTVVAADAADLDTLSNLIAEAFHPLAPSQWLIPDAAARRAVFPAYFRLYLEHAMASGVVHTTPDRTGTALWVHVGADGPAEPADYAARLSAATGRWAYRFRAFDAALDTRHPVGTPHHHLAILAVHPDTQGQGTGTALLRAHHHILDEDAHAPAYLEASDQRTRQFYLDKDYSDHGLPIRLPGGPLMYPMMREPRPPAPDAATGPT